MESRGSELFIRNTISAEIFAFIEPKGVLRLQQISTKFYNEIVPKHFKRILLPMKPLKLYSASINEMVELDTNQNSI